jgi:hypothetical protein
MDQRVEDLLLRWEQLREQGRSVSAEELCGDCPELLPDLRQRIEALAAMNRALATLPLGEPKTEAAVTGGGWRVAGGADAGPPPSPLHPPPVDQSLATIGSYRVLEEIGRGGMGVVYKAVQEELGRVVALKMILDGEHAGAEVVSRFRQEAQAVARLHHPNIVQVYEVGRQDDSGRPYFSLEYLGGGTLEGRLRQGPLPPRMAAEMIEVLARAIAAAHRAGIVHRDLKPGNVLFTEEGIPKVADFGLAKKLDGPGGHTRSGDVLGTPCYMAPEQAAGRNRDVGPAADVYALGAILYEMLTGRPPFDGVSPLDVVLQVLGDEPMPPSHLNREMPRDLETICLKCLRKEPKKRYASAGDLADDCAAFLRGEPIRARPVGSLARVWRWCRRRPSAAALVALAVLVPLVLAGLGARFSHRLSKELERTETARRDAVAAEHQLEQVLTRQVAERLDSELRQLAAVPQTMAALLGERTDWTDEQLEAWVRGLLGQRQRIFGMCVAFEPFAFAPGREDYALFVYRTAGGLKAKQLLPPDYQPPYRQWSWYSQAAREGHPCWSEPYVGTGADHTPMVTCSAPFARGGKLAGVVTADLATAYFRHLHAALGLLRLPPGSYCFVLSHDGSFLYHPEERHEFPAEASHLDRVEANEDFLALARRALEEESGSGQATDFTTGQRADFFFARVPSTGWAFVVVAPAEPAGSLP